MIDFHKEREALREITSELVTLLRDESCSDLVAADVALESLEQLTASSLATIDRIQKQTILEASKRR